MSGSQTSPTDDTTAQLAQIMQMIQGQQQAPPAQPTQERSFVSLLGSALGGGSASPMATADEEAAGKRALMNFGINMLAAGGPSTTRVGFGQALARGLAGAGESEAASEGVIAARLGAQQDYQTKQQELQLARLKEAIPLLTLQQQRKLMGLPNPLATSTGTGPPSIGAATGNPPTIARGDPSTPAGWAANNPGNLMYAGQPGVSGTLPLSGGRTLAAFPDMPSGVAANANQILTNQDQHGINTVRGMVTRWVSDPKADLTSYVADTAKALGVDPDKPIDFHDQQVLEKFILAQQPHETGGKGISLNPADVKAGVTLALTPRAAPGGTGTTTAATPPPATTTPPAGSTAPTRETFVKDPATGTVRKVTVPVQPSPAAPPGVMQTDQPAGGATVAGPPGTAIVGAAKPPGPAVSGDVNTMIRGMIGAGANATTLAPGAATSGPVAPPAVVAAATPPAATPPAVTTTPPTVPTPQVTTQQATPDTRPDVELKPGEYLQRHIQPVTVPTVTVNQDAMQRAQQVMADAAKSKSAAAQALGLALTDETRIKAGDAYTKANADWQNANQAVSTLQQQAAIETAKAQAKAEEDQRQRLTTTYNQLLAEKATAANQATTLQATAAENEKNRQAEIAKINAQAGATERTAALNPINTESAAAAHRLDDLQVLKGFSDNLGNPTFLTSYKVGGQSLADIISGAGLGSQALQDKAGQAQAFRAVALSIVRDLRLGGAATGEPRSNQDLQFITSMVPSEMQSPATRNAIISYIEQINQRRMEYGAEVGRLVTTPQYSNNVGGAILAARQAMPDMLQTVPKELAYGGGDVGQKRLDWFREKVQPGTFYRAPNGRMQVWNGVKGDPDYIP